MYEVGDVVKLNSGGPDMTVRRADDDGVLCRWFRQTTTPVTPGNGAQDYLVCDYDEVRCDTFGKGELTLVRKGAGPCSK